ncbi:hypothetical protein WJX79_002805 [Trebouxia sp. C0005]
MSVSYSWQFSLLYQDTLFCYSGGKPILLLSTMDSQLEAVRQDIGSVKDEIVKTKQDLAAAEQAGNKGKERVLLDLLLSLNNQLLSLQEEKHFLLRNQAPSLSHQHVFVNGGAFLEAKGWDSQLQFVASSPHDDIILLQGPPGEHFVLAQSTIQIVTELASATYQGALPNSSGAPVLDDTRTLRGVHIGTSFHLDTAHQPAEKKLSPEIRFYKDLAEDSKASFASLRSQTQPTHSKVSAMSRATSVATSLISRTHSTFLQGHKNLGLKRKSLWTQVTFVRSLHDVGCSTFHTGLALGMGKPTGVSTIMMCVAKFLYSQGHLCRTRVFVVKGLKSPACDETFKVTVTRFRATVLYMTMMTTNHELDNSDTQDSLHAVFEYQNQGTTQVHLLRCVDI